MTKATKDFPFAAPSETIDRGFDFCDGQLEDGEVLSSATFTLEVAAVDDGKSADPSPATRLIGASAIDISPVSGINSLAVQRLSGLIDGNTYRLICRATSSNGQVLEQYAHLPCHVAI